jgi:hypothetical protein
MSLERNTRYEHTLSIEHNDIKYRGVVVFPPSSNLNLTIRNTRGGDLDYILVESRHRDVVFEDEGGKWKYKYKYSTKRESGIVYFKGFDLKGNHSFGAAILTDGSEKLKGNLHCNGESYMDKTVTACESKKGLTQYIEFSEDVLMEQEVTDPKCLIKAPEIFRELEFELGTGWCNYTFVSIDTGEVHSLWAFGYELHMIPGGK